MHPQAEWLIPVEELDLVNGLVPADVDGEWVVFPWDAFDHPATSACRIEGRMACLWGDGVQGRVAVLADTVRIDFGDDEPRTVKLTVSGDGNAMRGFWAGSASWTTAPETMATTMRAWLCRSPLSGPRRSSNFCATARRRLPLKRSSSSARTGSEQHEQHEYRPGYADRTR